MAKNTKLIGEYIAANYKFAPHSQDIIDSWNNDLAVFNENAEKDAIFRIQERERLARLAEEAAAAAVLEDLRD